MQIPANANARGMVFNARMLEIVQFFSLVKAHTKNWPARGIVPTSAAVLEAVSSTPSEVQPSATVFPPSGTSPSFAVTPPADTSLTGAGCAGEETPAGRQEKALVVLLLNRSLDDPFATDPQNAWTRLQAHANQILSAVSKGSEGKIEAAVVSYGRDAAGEIEVRTTFDGPLAGQTVVKDCDLSAGSLRVDEVEQQEPNGVGGLMTITVKRKVFVELDPTPLASTQPAFAAVSQLVGSWCATHPAARMPPVVLHLTHDAVDAEELEKSAGVLSQVQTEDGTVRLYHLVATEKPHASVSYPETDDGLQTLGLKKLWTLSSPLLAVEQLAASHPFLVRPNSRGMVVNAKFDLLLKGITSGRSS
jgi:hypothetical protein